jgi:hypothetical protein
MLRTLIASCLVLTCCAAVGRSQDAHAYSKLIVGKWLDSHSNKATIFRADGSWAVQRADDMPEQVHGRWWIKRNKLFLTYPTDQGVGTPVHIVTASYNISFSGDDHFTTDTHGYKDIYERVRQAASSNKSPEPTADRPVN